MLFVVWKGYQSGWGGQKVYEICWVMTMMRVEFYGDLCSGRGVCGRKETCWRKLASQLLSVLCYHWQSFENNFWMWLTV